MRADKYEYKEYTKQDLNRYYLVYCNVGFRMGLHAKSKNEHKSELAKKVVIYNFARN